MAEISTYAKQSGRLIQEDGQVINQANILAPEPIAFEQLTVDATVGGIALTAAKYGTNAIKANIQVEGAPIRVTVDGKTAPTATVGRLVDDGDEIELESLSEYRNIGILRDMNTLRTKDASTNFDASTMIAPQTDVVNTWSGSGGTNVPGTITGLYEAWRNGYAENGAMAAQRITTATSMLFKRMTHNGTDWTSGAWQIIIPSNIKYNYTGYITIAELVAGKTLIAASAFAGKAIKILGYWIKVSGDFSVGGGTNVKLQDNNGSPVVALTIAKAALTDGAKLSHYISSIHVSEGAGFIGALTAGKDLVIPASVGISGGTALTISIDYSLV